MFKPKLAVAMVLLLLTCAAAVLYRDNHRAPASLDTISLLLPDSANEKDTQVQVWTDAAQEEGLHLHVIRDSALLDPMFKIHSSGLIVPDQVHRRANDALIGALHRYVEQGGKLMVVYDACTWDLNDRYPEHGSRLSDLVGIDYALYERFGTASIATGNVWGAAGAMDVLAIPPGSYAPGRQLQDKSPLRKVDLRSSANSTNDRQFLVGYLYGELEYPSFQTVGEFQGKTLLESTTGLVAGVSKHGAGNVLFVNLPLGYLTTRTDGMLLHSFLRYFSLHMLHLPILSAVPDGIGGVVMNWHIDAASALKPMAILRNAGIFDYGPFSADFTAGPDVDEFDDGHGLNLRGSTVAQSWVRFLRERGDEIGSHGGWIHNYFGKHLSETNADSFRQYLQLNKQAIEAVGGSVTEYSAPLGNHPEWVTEWLEQNGVVAYYFTGDAGMGPTRVYRDQGREGDKIWAFPILHLGQEASLEEMLMDSVPESEVRNWLLNISDFTSSLHVVRLVYSHPFGAARYLEALKPWFQHTQALAATRQFRWYTMSQIANFLNARQDVIWEVEDHGNHSLLKASHPQSLEHQSWMLPDRQYDKPRVEDGSAEIRDQDGYWIAAAGKCKHLRLRLTERRTEDTNPQAPH